MAQQRPPAEGSVAYTNGKIFTINSAHPWAEAFIVSPNGIFTHVGRSSLILSLAKANGLVVYDLHNAFIMPGLHDAHTHMLPAGLQQLNEVNISYESESNASNIAGRIREAGCRCEYAHAYGDWIVVNGYDNRCFEDMKPDRKYLDEEFPDTPVIVRGGGGHAWWLNSEALRRAGYDENGEEDNQDGVQGVYVRRGNDGKGELTGEVFENGQVKAALALPVPPLAQAKRALQRAIEMCHKVGITSVQDASANTLQMMALAELEKEGKLDLDFAAHLVHAPEYLAFEKKAASLGLIDRAEEFRSKHVDTRFVKIMLDGVPFPPLFSHCELDEHGKPNLKKLVTGDMEEAVLKYDARGMTVKIHCTGQGSTRLALDAFTKARERNPNGPRHEIAHCNAVHPEDWERFQPLNITAENSPAAFFSSLEVTAETTGGAIDWDFQRVLGAKPLATIGSDWFSSPTPELIHSVFRKVEQVGGGDKAKGGQILCRMLTLSGAEAVGKESEIGSIEVGKRANFIAVDRDLSRGEFEEAKVMKTWFEGRLVFSRDA